ncbi:MAG: hypothetical protein ACRCTS_03515 [Fusobacteriaceae bacterium]
MDFYLVYTAHPLKPDPKAKSKDNTNYKLLKEFKEQSVLLKERILERKLTEREKELIIGNKKEERMSQEDIDKNIQEIKQKIMFDKNQNMQKK